MHDAPTPARLAALADQCVMCGLCLPYCPTYAAGRQEGEGPRGRIALIKGLAGGTLPATPALVDHLDSCLACRRCEAVCPAGVRYGELIAGARALPELARRMPRWRRPLDRWLARTPRRRVLQTLRSPLRPLRPLLRRSRAAHGQRLAELAALPAPFGNVAHAPATPDRPETASGATMPGNPDAVAREVTARRSIALFAGCVASDYERALHDGARRLFAALGEHVAPAPVDLCCGALARASGDAADAHVLQGRLVDALGDRADVVVLGTATGCQAQLAGTLRGTGTAVEELTVWLAAHPQLEQLRFAPLDEPIAVHRPCSQRLLGADSAKAVDRLLARIPALRRIDLPEQDRCCGAAGTHFLARPAQSRELRARVLADVAQASPRIVVSGNVGCRLYLDAGLPDAAARIEFVHPVELLARQLLP